MNRKEKGRCLEEQEQEQEQEQEKRKGRCN
jgi:hypothetical protein